MKLLPENLGDETLLRMIDVDDGDILADISFLASMRRREGVPLEKVLLGSPSLELLRRRTPASVYESDGKTFVAFFGGPVEVGIDPDDVATPIELDPDLQHR